MKERHHQSSHFDHILPRHKAKHTIKECLELLKPMHQLYDTFVFSGYSGACVAPTLAHLLDKELLLIRKNQGNDGSNSKQWIEGHIGAQNVIIVDDFICSGKTMCNIMQALRHMRTHQDSNVKIVGVLFTCKWANSERVALMYRPGSFEFQNTLSTEFRDGGGVLSTAPRLDEDPRTSTLNIKKDLDIEL
jgi:phosphoribosylpyrophosphate synthetase